MNALESALGIVAFVVVLLGSVMVHEFGHFLTAKRFGMKVTEFFVGFGARIWSFRRGETEYGIKAVPAGGYVKIVGMSDLEEVDPQDEPRAFHRAPAWERAVVLAMGSIMHGVIALVLVLLAAGAVGLPGGASTTVGAVSACAPASADATSCAGQPASPAQRSGLLAGDRFVSWDGRAVTTWERLQADIRGDAGQTVPVVVDRDGRRVSLEISPVARQRGGASVGLIGVSPTETIDRQGPVRAVETAGSTVGSLLMSTFTSLRALPAAVPALLRQTFGDQPRSAEGLVGVVGIARISGEIATSAVPWQLRVSSFLLTMAGINVFIGVFNLLPIPPLDGGHLLMLVLERVRARWAAWRGRPDPGRLDVSRVLPLAYVVVVLFVGLSVVLLVADVINPVRLPQ